mmetsp:Transcript_14065/g.52776  ORF Transcript_14065/g.52776 Transcript_14065/m.52776 type:complete len:95 (+) Transcript_14065:729-1013(+)
MLPRWTTQILSLSTSVDSRCAIATHVLPRISSLSAVWTPFSLFVSSAAVASSSRSSFGCLTMARAIVSRCFCPPLRLCALVSKRRGRHSTSCQS